MAVSKKRMLADVLWEAANVRLSADGAYTSGTECWSCNAAMWAEMGNRYSDQRWRGSIFGLRNESKAAAFLKSLGCPIASNNAFGYAYGDTIQGVRYMWLLLAMHVAEDEGLTV
jgi:hypothetical protein